MVPARFVYSKVRRVRRGCLCYRSYNHVVLISTDLLPIWITLICQPRRKDAHWPITMASTVFSASGEDIINKCLSPSSSTSLYPKSSADHCHADHPEETLDQAYEIQRCVQWIHKLGVSKVALQFPDELLVDAPDVALAIEMKSGTEIYILGDTSYGRYISQSYFMLYSS